MDDLMEVLCQWWTTVKDHEAMQQILGRDPAGNVSDGCLVGDSAEQLTTRFRIALYSNCFIMDLRKKGVRISRNFMVSVSDTSGFGDQLI